MKDLVHFHDFSNEPVDAESVGDRGGTSKVCDRLDAFLACLTAFVVSIASTSACFIGTPPIRPRGASVPLPFGAAYLLRFLEFPDALESLDESLSIAEDVSLLFEFIEEEELIIDGLTGRAFDFSCDCDVGGLDVVGSTDEVGVLAPVFCDLMRLKESENCFWDCFASSLFVSFSTILRALAPLAAMRSEFENAIQELASSREECYNEIGVDLPSRSVQVSTETTVVV